jgi:hypothetical protein
VDFSGRLAIGSVFLMQVMGTIGVRQLAASGWSLKLRRNFGKLGFFRRVLYARR